MVRTWAHIGFATPLLLTWCSVDRLLRKLRMSWDTSHWGAQAFTRNWTRGVSSRLLFHGLEVRDENLSIYCFTSKPILHWRARWDFLFVRGKVSCAISWHSSKSAASGD